LRTLFERVVHEQQQAREIGCEQAFPELSGAFYLSLAESTQPVRNLTPAEQAPDDELLFWSQLKRFASPLAFVVIAQMRELDGLRCLSRIEEESASRSILQVFDVTPYRQPLKTPGNDRAIPNSVDISLNVSRNIRNGNAPYRFAAPYFFRSFAVLIE
jgi:hypothetical protein